MGWRGWHLRTFRSAAQHPVDGDLLGKHGGQAHPQTVFTVQGRGTRSWAPAFRCAGRCHHLVQVAFVVPVQAQGCGDKGGRVSFMVRMEGCAAAADHGGTAKNKKGGLGHGMGRFCASGAHQRTRQRRKQQCVPAQRSRFAALGYAWVVGCAVVALALVAWALPQLLQGRFRFGLVLLLLAAGSLLWVSLRALWVRIAPPEAKRSPPKTPRNCSRRWSASAAKVKGPAIHHVLLSDEFNASIQQIPRYGLFGGGTTIW